MSVGFIGQFPLTVSSRGYEFIHSEVPKRIQSAKLSPRKCCARSLRRNVVACQNAEIADGGREMNPRAKELRSLLKKCSIYFVGSMGSGKSVVAKYVARQLGYRFLDTDELIELAAKQTIPEIFTSYGEDAFRDLESAILDQVQAVMGTCIATGGGAVIRNSNWGPMQTGIVVWLKVPVPILAKRLHDDTTRPLLAGHDSLEALEARLEDILTARNDKYSQADVTVFVSEHDGVDDIGLEVMRRVANFIKENPPRFAQVDGLHKADDVPPSPPTST